MLDVTIEDLIKDTLQRICYALDNNQPGDAKPHIEILILLKQALSISCPTKNWYCDKPFEKISEKHV